MRKALSACARHGNRRSSLARAWAPDVGAGPFIALRPEFEPRLVVKEELPVVGNRLPDRQKWHRRYERSKSRVVDRSPLVAFVESSHDESIVLIGRNRKNLQDVVEECLCPIRRQVGEDDDDRLLDRFAVHWLSIEEDPRRSQHRYRQLLVVPRAVWRWRS